MYRAVVGLTLLWAVVGMMSDSTPALARGRTRSRNYSRRGGRRGYGYGTNWMQNPYQGYLNGAANLTTANARYQLTIQQAKLLREQARRSALQTRRATLEEHEYERSLQPDPEQIRQEQMRKSLERSRHNPPAVEIWSGAALNDLLRDIQTADTDGLNAADVPFSPEILKHLNMTTGTTYGGIGLLRDGGKLTWPYALRESKNFATEREQLEKLLPPAVKEAHSGPVRADRINQIRSALKKLENAVDAQADNVTPSEFTEASRYLRELNESLQVLEQNDVAKYFRAAWTPKGATVAQLVQQMTEQGLHFAPAVSGDEPYYTSLHRALVSYDHGIAELSAPLLHSP